MGASLPPNSKNMNFLTLENITRSYGEKLLFKNIDLIIDKGQKIGLIAKNGSGKTTLLKVIAGREGSEGEQAKITFRKGIRIGWLDQEPDFAPGLDVIGAILDDTENPLVVAVRKYELAMLHPENMDEVQDAMQMMDDLKAWTFESRMQEALSRFSLDNFQQQVSQLSGGQQKRLALVRLLLQDPDFLILDEPTNHLDVEMIEYIEEYLQQPSVTLFMVTHDRYFLENICDQIIELDGGVLHRYKGNYSDYLEKKALREEIESSTYEKTNKMLTRELDWVRKSPQARTTKSKSRVDAYYDKKDTNDALKNQTTEMSIKIKETWLGSKIVELHNVSKKFGEKTLVDNFSYKFKRKERVGIIGPNGTGKSTFLNLITKGLEPDTGKVVVGDTISYGFYKQDGIKLSEDKRVIDAVRDVAEVIELEKGKVMTAAALLERFLFTRPQQSVYVSQLSGGERRRLYLLLVLMKNPNFLILDEPTNDLDVLTLQVLEDFLEDFPGCLVIVTHDRYFMDRLVEHLFVFEGEGKIRDFNGTYAEYRQLKREEDALRKQGKPVPSETVAAPRVSEGMSNAERNELKRIEREMKTLEERKAAIMLKFEDTTLPMEQMTKLSAELGKVQDEMEEKEMRWLELSEKEG
jgi:ABC transport system ATP-binding/permease protein